MQPNVSLFRSHSVGSPFLITDVGSACEKGGGVPNAFLLSCALFLFRFVYHLRTQIIVAEKEVSRISHLCLTHCPAALKSKGDQRSCRKDITTRLRLLE